MEDESYASLESTASMVSLQLSPPTAALGFQSITPLTEGGFSTIFTAVDSNSMPVIVKKVKLLTFRARTLSTLSLAKPTIQNQRTFGVNPQQAKSEAHILQNSNHPNILKLYDVFIKKSYLWLILQPGVGDLHSLLFQKSKGRSNNIAPISDELIFYLLSPICSAIRYLHTLGVVNRDIKEDNILLVDENGQLVTKLCDLGSAKIFHAGILPIRFGKKAKGQVEMLGSLFYMSPELIKREPYYPNVDVYSFGITMWSLKKNSKPFGNLAYEKLNRFLVKRVPQLNKVSDGNQVSAQERLYRFMSISKSDTSNLVQVVKQCVILDPQSRPDAESLLLNTSIKNMNDEWQTHPISEVLSQLQDELYTIIKSD
eukprot:snap_masked-scaffold_49-processed-gene-1.52-mRNA-1 protein AED:0.36 eAED:0.41 QI:0/-1/0/1/-1/1/1/0/369